MFKRLLSLSNKLNSINNRQIKHTITITRQTHSTNYTAYDLSKHRALISVQGHDSQKFLQGIITNDIQHLSYSDHRLIYSMILNSRGRVMYDVLIYYLVHNVHDEPHYLVEVDGSHVDNAIKYFNLYKVKRKVKISNANDNYKLYSVIHKTNNESEQFKNLIKESHKNDVLIFQADPRYKGLGYRLILNNLSNIKVSDVLNETTTTSDNIDEYKKYLYQQGVAEGAENITYGNSIALEYNIVFLNGVSFNKGCYLGQELIAKTHHTGVIRKRIIPFEMVNKESIDKKDFNVNNLIVNTKSGQTIGKLKGIVDGSGIGLIRLAHIDNSNMTLIDNNGCKHQIQVHIPKYWQIDEALSNELKSSNLQKQEN